MSEVRSTKMGTKVSAAVPRLWAALRVKGWSQRDLAKLIGTTNSLVNRWLHCRQKPGRRFAKAIELHCGVSQEDWDAPPRRPFELRIVEKSVAA